MIYATNENSNLVSKILEKSGKYNYFQTILICITTCTVVWANLNFVFIAGDVNYRCKVNECEDPNQTFIPDWWPNEDIDHCSRPVLNLTMISSSNTCTKQSFTYQEERCTEWVYETNDTIVSELNLTCQLWKQNMVGTIHGIGMLFPVLVSGWMADRFGRKLTLIICSVGYVIGYFKLLATSYTTYLVIEFLEASFAGGVLASGAVLLIENTPKKKRMLAGVLFACAFYVGEFFYAILGMVANKWKTLILIIYSPCLLFLSYVFLLKESPRWQVLHGKITEAKSTLSLMAQMNKVEINIEELENLDGDKLKQLFNLDKENKREGFKQVFTSLEMIKRFAMGFVTRFTVSFIYHSLMMNSVYLPGNKYTNFMFGALASYPGEFLSLILMGKYGRKLPLMYGFAICGVVSVGVEVIPDSYTWLKIVMFAFAKMGISACFTGAVTYTMEVFPTSVRGSLIGLCTLASNIGNLLAPLIPSLSAVSPLLPPVCYGTSALLSTCLLFLTPETSNLPLPDTIQQIEKASVNTKEAVKKVESQDNLGFEHDLT